MIWATVLVSSLCCYLLKLGGLSVPQRILMDQRVQRVAMLLPVALLVSLVTTQTFSNAHRLTVDARLAGIAAAVIALLLRAPFLVVVAAGAAATALVRLWL
jgi:branched-subunit amino acid transport protein